LRILVGKEDGESPVESKDAGRVDLRFQASHPRQDETAGESRWKRRMAEQQLVSLLDHMGF